jgi:RNA polymerase sigma factor (sigma-70 family)
LLIRCKDISYSIKIFENFILLLTTKEIRALSDEQLLKILKTKVDNRLLGELLGRYIKFVFLISMKYFHNDEQAKDIAMQVFEKVQTDIYRFEILNFKSWLHVVTKNTCLMQLRSDKSIAIHEKEFEKNMKTDVVLHHDYDGEKELKIEQLEKAIDNLDGEQKQCVELFYIKEKSYKEVADITGFSMSEVKSHLQNGKRNLKNLLLKNGDVQLFILICLILLKH